MSDRIVRAFEDKRNNPFTFKHIKLCHSMAEIDALPEPKVRFTCLFRNRKEKNRNMIQFQFLQKIMSVRVLCSVTV